MSKYINRFKKSDNGLSYQSRVGHWPKHKFLTENSINMAKILNENKILKDGINIFEMGSGGCRNFKYINDLNENINFYANDLNEDASFQNMHDDIKDKVTFFEKDTLSLVREYEPDFKIDLLISSGHFMHIDTESFTEILDVIKNKWKPQQILLREVFDKEKENVTREYPRHCHDYDLEDLYDFVFIPDNFRIYTLKNG